MDLRIFPTINASLNLTCTVFLVLGYFYIRKDEKEKHGRCMIAACITSAVFLACYLYYHYHHGSTPYTQEGWTRAIYFPILISHIILAVVIVPLVLMTVIRAARGEFEKHAKIARWTFPLWLYVSVTGVLVYVMLYHWPGPGASA